MANNLHRNIGQGPELGLGYEGPAGDHALTLPLDAGGLLLVGASKLGLVQTVDTLSAVLSQTGATCPAPDLPSIDA